MNAENESEAGAVKNRTTVERKSDRETIAPRSRRGPAHAARASPCYRDFDRCASVCSA